MIRINLRYILFFSICLYSVQSKGQDFSYTQSFAHTSTLNPAMTGLHNGQYKLSLLNRNQWIRATEKPFNMVGGYVDFRSKLPLKIASKDAFGMGLGFVSETQGILDFKKNVFHINLAYHKALDYKGDQLLSAGFQLGFMQHALGYENITFFDQFDGTGFNLATSENLPQNSFNTTDVSLGLSYQNKITDYQQFALGLAMFHANAPNIAFHGNDVATFDETENNLYAKFIFYTYFSWAVSNDLSLTPRIITKVQGPNSLTSVGGTARVKLKGFQEQAMHLGVFLHSGKTIHSSFKPHTVSLLMGYELNNFNLGLSYDVGVVNRYNWSQNVGNFELSLTYFGFLQNGSGVGCPIF